MPRTEPIWSVGNVTFTEKKESIVISRLPKRQIINMVQMHNACDPLPASRETNLTAYHSASRE